jgi:hypothetical protein
MEHFPAADLSSWLSPSGAARSLDLSVARIHQLLRSGDLPATRTPLGYLIDPQDIAALRARRSRS